jgi:glycerol-3-phosphate cytidylyltransferase
MKKILVDMSAVIIHPGHVRIINKAKKYGKVYIALTTDKEIKKRKKINPELNYLQRKEILMSFKNVEGVIASPWLIDEKFLSKHNIDMLVHGNDNSNQIPKKKLLIFSRTKGISTSIIRKKCFLNYKNKF